MKITQEQLDKDAIADYCFETHGIGSAPLWAQLVPGIQDYHRNRVRNVFEAHFGEEVEVIEPEPEIPEVVLSVVRDALGYASRSIVKDALLAAYKAGWGGMRE